jgi:putative drug exporter of the RND superfamily
MSPVQHRQVRKHGARTPDDRFATWLRRLRWPAVIAWVLAIAALYGLSSGLSGVTNDQSSAHLPASAASTKVVLLQQAAAQATSSAAGQSMSSSAIAVFASSGPLTAADRATIRSARTAVAALIGHVAGVAAPSALQTSADGKAVAFSVNISGPVSAVRTIRAAIAKPVAAAGSGLTAAVTGPAAVEADTSSGHQQTTLLLTALVVVAVILLLVYLSPILWLLPLFSAIAAIIVAQASAHGLANTGLTVSRLSADILIVLVFGAATDYALLLVHRYREELRHQAMPEAAMATAMRTTLPTILASAGTVTCAMLCLLAADSASLHGLGPVGAVGIVSAFLAQATLLPALLLLAGRAAFWPLVPRCGDSGREEPRIWAGIGSQVARRPAATAVIVLVLLGAACAGVASLRFSNDPIANVKGNPGSVAGEQLLTRHFPAGTGNPLVLLVPPGQAATAVAAARATAGAGSVAPGGTVAGYDSYSVTLPVDPFGPAGTSALASLRQRLSAGAPGALVGGNPAIAYDEARAAGRDDAIIIPLVLVVILVILALLLQAVVAPVVLTATTALSFAASLGLSSLLWHGLGYESVQSVIPAYIFIFLVALGVDYNIFLSARIREESRHVNLRDATVRGLGVTGGVITAAGIVLAGTFAALTRIPQVNVTEVGTAVMLGVLLDTFVVRTVLVPACLLTIGEHIWWPSHGGVLRSGPTADSAAE